MASGCKAETSRSKDVVAQRYPYYGGGEAEQRVPAGDIPLKDTSPVIYLFQLSPAIQ